MSEEDKKSEGGAEVKETESKVTVTESNENSSKSPLFINESLANETYAQLISREDKSKKKGSYFMSHPLKDISKLRKYRKGEMTLDKDMEEFPRPGKKIIKVEDNVKKNMDGSKGDDVQKGKYCYGKKRFDHLDVMADYNKKIKPEERFKKDKNNKNMERRIKDCYMNNPIEILNKTQTEEMNKVNRTKMLRSVRAVEDYMGSKKTQHALRSFNTSSNLFVDKITNNPPEAIKKSIMENRRNNKPYFGRLKFNHYVVNGKNQVGYL